MVQQATQQASERRFSWEDKQEPATSQSIAAGAVSTDAAGSMGTLHLPSVPSLRSEREAPQARPEGEPLSVIKEEKTSSPQELRRELKENQVITQIEDLKKMKWRELKDSVASSLLCATTSAIAVGIPTAAWIGVSKLPPYSGWELFGGLGAAALSLAGAVTGIFFAVDGVKDAFKGVVRFFSPATQESSALFEQAKNLHSANESSPQNGQILAGYIEASKAAANTGNRVLLAKCAYAVMSLIEKEKDPSSRAEMVASFFNKADNNLVGTRVAAAAGDILVENYESWLNGSWEHKRGERLDWVGPIFKCAYRQGSEGEIKAAQQFYKVSQNLKVPAEKHKLLNALFHQLGSEAQELRTSIETDLVENASLLAAGERFAAIRQIAEGRGLSKGSNLALARSLSEEFEKLGVDDQMLAMDLILKLRKA